MSDSDPRTAREEWGSRFGSLMAMFGAMMGADNIWRVPSTMGEDGGGTFFVAYILLLYLIAVPGLMAEAMIGRYTNYGVIGALRKALGSKRAQSLGLAALIVSAALISYYVPIIGWALCYTSYLILMTFTQPGFQSQAFWEGLINSPALVAGMRMVMMAGLASVLVFGIRRGTERVVKWMIPLLVVALVAVSIRGITLPGGMEGAVFVFMPDWGYLTRGSMWVAVLSQALFSMGLGWEIALTYGSYLSRYDDVPLGGGLFTAIGDTSIGLLAVFVMFPVVFVFGLEPSAGSNLPLISMVQIFPELPGGSSWAIVFFVSFFSATFTSGLGIAEVAATTVSEGTRLSRTSAVFASCGVIRLSGLPSVYSPAFLGRMDFMFGSFGLLLVTFSTIALVAWKFGPERARALDLNCNAGVCIGSWWNPVVKYVIPVVMMFILGYGVYSNIGTVNQRLMLFSAAFMAAFVVVGTFVMSVIGDEPPSGFAAVPGSDD